LLSRGGDVKQSLFNVNRELARDMRRGMYVSALYVVIEPGQHRAMVACAGHKFPLVRWSAADGKVRLIHPEGIALGFDKGPIFERRLELTEVAIEPGDRLVLANTGPAVLKNDAGAEFGEKQLYTLVQRFGPKPTEEFLERIRSVLEAYAGKTSIERDIALLTVARR
jgi:serine phosphatase RsbU (regulator of sigma subunit)